MPATRNPVMILPREPIVASSTPYGWPWPRQERVLLHCGHLAGMLSDSSREPALERAMPAAAVRGSTIPEDSEAEVLLHDGTWVRCQVIGQRKDQHGRWCVGIRRPVVAGLLRGGWAVGAADRAIQVSLRLRFSALRASPPTSLGGMPSTWSAFTVTTEQAP